METTTKTALSTSKLPGLDYSLNPYTGCSHGCVYCYAASTLNDRNLASRWGDVVFVKTNITEVLEQEVKVKKRGIVGVSTVTDPYQPPEALYKLTRKSLIILKQNRFRISIQTKSSLILRDKDIIEPKLFDVGVTITTIDPNIAKILEPSTPPPIARIKVLKEFANSGVETWIFLGPLIPTINDDTYNIEQIINIAKETNSYILYDKLNIRKYVTEILKPTLEKHWPGVSKYIINLSRSPTNEYWTKRYKTIEELCKKLGVKCEPAFQYKQTNLSEYL
ncbi:MAG: SPL family radical SAM protein [Thermoprotei archaeon]